MTSNPSSQGDGPAAEFLNKCPECDGEGPDDCPRCYGTGKIIEGAKVDGPAKVVGLKRFCWRLWHRHKQAPSYDNTCKVWFCEKCEMMAYKVISPEDIYMRSK